MKKNMFSTQTSINLNSHLSASANINYVTQKVNGEFSDTYGNNASGSFNQWFHRDLDVNILKELKDLRTPTGQITGWNLDDGGGITKNGIYAGTLYWTNPYTYFELAKATRTTDRLFGDMGLTYKFNAHFKLSGTFRRSQMNQSYETMLPGIFETSTSDFQSALAINENALIRPVRATYRTFLLKRFENNYEFLSSYNNDFGKFGVDFNFGGNIRRNEQSYIDAGTKGGLVVPDLFTLSNSKVQPFYYDNARSKKEVRSLYGRGSLAWNDVVTLDFSLRNDWSSALPANSNSYLYPSVGTSIILTKYLQPSITWLTYMKIRGSWAQVGSDLDPYQLTLTYKPGSSQWAGNITMTTPDKFLDPNIKPSLSSSYEAGLDIRVLNNKIAFSGTYYNEIKSDEILEVPVAGASGFSSNLINAGKLKRSGIELTLDATIARTKNFQWQSSLNFSKTKSKIDSLAPGITEYVVGRADYNRAGRVDYAPVTTHVVHGEWGQVRGRAIKKVDGVNVIDKSTGLYEYEDNYAFGSVLPEFTGGWTNQFSFKGLTLSAVIDFSKGGKYYSLSEFWGNFSGLYENTAGLNDKGKPVRDPVSQGGGVHVVGVDKNKAAVDMYVDAIDYFQGNGGNKIHELYVHDASFVKLRELSLTYRVPVDKLNGLNKVVQTLHISAFARNPWLIYSANRNFDPSEFVGLYGESGQLPPARSYGLTVKVGF
jgi:outer membrane receptor protein involved in Fe transport